MSFAERPELSVPALRVLSTAIDLGDGGTAEQQRLVEVLATAIWGMEPAELHSLTAITPAEATTIFDGDEVASLRLQQLLILVEMLRSPQVPEQLEIIEVFATALVGDDDGLELARAAMREGSEQTVQHFVDKWHRTRSSVSDRAVLDRYHAIDVVIDDPELAALLRGMRDLPRGTLGREYIEFYLVNEFDIPGEGIKNPAFFVQHDMSHLLAGLPPTAAGEISLSAFQLGMCDNEEHWTVLLLNLAAYQIGLRVFGGDCEPVTAVLARDGALNLYLGSYLRGKQCRANYNEVSLLHRIEDFIDDVRADFAITAPPEPFPVLTGPPG